MTTTSMSDISSSTTPIVAGETFAPKVVLGATIKLNGANYLLWAQAFRIFIGAQSKLPHLLASPPPTSDPTYNSWLSSDYCVMTWLLNSMEAQISSSVMFLTTAKEMWDNLKIMYGNEKNVSRVFKIYERLFAFKQGDKSVPEFFGELKGLIDELEMHQPAVADAATLLGYRRDLAVSKFLSGLNSNLQSQVRGQILGGDTIPSLTAIFFRVMQVSTGVTSDTTTPSPPTMDQSVMFSNRGKGRGRGRGRDSGGGRGSFGGRQGESDKGSRQCGHYGRINHISEKCWEKFGRPQWAQVADTESTNSSISATTSDGPAVTAPTVQISQADYERLRQLELSQNIHSTTHASSSGPSNWDEDWFGA
ncbi:uncharacterized protein LOC109836748 isoform X2 [Asparagus officinalis]|uniref:uncharacterized protein LOC109836748 isoform X2 n=1 Tax=Asparagus officinalis TaxID=4686 RepID=UPI00098E7774|nr:uncharacterized protein LOC109836748 isoform X2 [Asparagus officinalis]